MRSRMWLAESRRRKLVRLECGFTREELVAELIASARRDPSLVVGLDFAFSFPNWFLEARRVADARELWSLVARRGEEWLANCPRPFWGKPLCPCPPPREGQSPWRATESERVPITGIRPKSIFQVGGAGTVGTGSLRGMPFLAKLQDAGFSIWPFDRARLPLVVEIYPRYLTGAVDKSSHVARSMYLQARHAREDRVLLERAASSEDAFDAAVSAACMQRFARDFSRIARAPRTARDRREGRIWVPLRDPLFER
ncbi:MAG TPA: hypothetical protein VM509_07300 [Planctomycetota bacterium]|nr:hypothetical protein [Planctomycetota bacterium]